MLLFSRLEKQAGAKAEMPAFPSQKLLVWIDKRHASGGRSAKARYKLLFEHLLIAQKLLHSPDSESRRQGLWVASESANFAAAHLSQDKWLLARLYEGFLLPHIGLANVPLWKDPSRGGILEAAVSAFGKAGEPNKQIAVLEWLLSLADQPSQTDPNALTLEANTLDWARGTLAALLVQRPQATTQDLERALALLQAIESPDMKGFGHLQARVQARLDKMKSRPTPVNTVPQADKSTP